MNNLLNEDFFDEISNEEIQDNSIDQLTTDHNEVFLIGFCTKNPIRSEMMYTPDDVYRKNLFNFISKISYMLKIERYVRKVEVIGLFDQYAEESVDIIKEVRDA